MTEPTMNGMMKITIDWDPNPRQRPGIVSECSVTISEGELILEKCPILRMAITKMLEGLGKSIPEIGQIIKKEGWKNDYLEISLPLDMPPGHLPESGDAGAGPRENKPSLCKPTPPNAGGSIPPSGSMTDEEALSLIDKRLSSGCATCDGECRGQDRCYTVMEYLRARLASKPKVTREQARGLVLALETFCRESGIPTDRVKELNVPQVFLDILGLEVEEEK